MRHTARGEICPPVGGPARHPLSASWEARKSRFAAGTYFSVDSVSGSAVVDGTDIASMTFVKQ